MTAIRQKVVLTEKEINDYASGKLSMQDIAKAHGCTKDTVSKRLKETKRADVIEQIQHNSKRGAAKLSEKQIQEIITRVKNGEEARDLAIEYHMDAASIRYHLKAHGIKAKRAERRDWVEVKSKTLSIDYDFSSIIPNNIFSKVNKMMTRSMRITSTDI